MVTLPTWKEKHQHNGNEDIDNKRIFVEAKLDNSNLIQFKKYIRFIKFKYSFM